MLRFWWLLVTLGWPSVAEEPCDHRCTCRSLTLTCRGLPRFPLYYPKNIVHIDLSGNELEHLPWMLPEGEQLEDLVLRGNRIAEVSPVFLSEAVRLRNLDLSRNRITYLPQGMLDSNRDLVKLDLSHNSIGHLLDIHPSTIFLHNYNLQVLDLSWNLIKELSGKKQTLLTSDSLLSLNLSNCGVPDLGPGVFPFQSIPYITSLDLSHNPLKRADGIILPSLRKLYLTGTRLRYLRREFYDWLPSLEELDISGNPELENLGKQPSSTSLRHLNASRCSINSLQLSGFPALVSLDVSGNNVRELTAYAFRASKELRRLDLSSNSISYIVANEFWGPAQPIEVDLSRNLLRGYDREGFSGVGSLRLSWNPLLELQDVSSKTLTRLEVAHSELSMVSPTLLSSLPRLESLNLTSNALPYFPHSLSSRTLRSLDLSGNRLDELRLGSFPRLELLDIRSNSLSELPEQLPEGAVIDDNPWYCDCSSLSPALLHRWGATTCASPPNATGLTFLRACDPPNPKPRRSAPLLSLVITAGTLAAVIVSLLLLRKRLASGEPPPVAASTPPPSPPPSPPRRIPLDTLPTYEEALLMPKLLFKKHTEAQTDHHSLADLAHSTASLPKLSSSL